MEFLILMSLSQRELADAIHLPYQRVNEIINGRRGVTSGTALRLARYFGTSAAFWMNTIPLAIPVASGLPKIPRRQRRESLVSELPRCYSG